MNEQVQIGVVLLPTGRQHGFDLGLAQEPLPLIAHRNLARNAGAFLIAGNQAPIARDIQNAVQVIDMLVDGAGLIPLGQMLHHPVIQHLRRQRIQRQMAQRLAHMLVEHKPVQLGPPLGK